MHDFEAAFDGESEWRDEIDGFVLTCRAVVRHDLALAWVNVEVVALSDGKFTYDGPMYAGLTGDLGTSAWLRHRGVNVGVVSARMQPLDMAFARSLGIDCAAMKYIAVKSAVHFRSGFEKLAGSIHNIDAQAIHTHDFARLPYRHRRRPMFPLDLELAIDN